MNKWKRKKVCDYLGIYLILIIIHFNYGLRLVAYFILSMYGPIMDASCTFITRDSGSNNAIELSLISFNKIIIAQEIQWYAMSYKFSVY